jgi:diaminohydroxyphosphoribosylaminopyrimidine deaminase/5-amino-6-(5-phosphoribosylamino)uracil reductase
VSAGDAAGEGGDGDGGSLRPGERAHLRAAVALAWRGRGHVEPNPCVGCVIAGPDGERIAIAAHRRFGEPHAEANALAAAGDRARGATAIVTLEPCDHHGKQPPCTEAIIAAGIRRVVFAVPDPNPEAAGGAARLRAAGLDVCLVDAATAAASGATALAAPFVHRVRTGRPWVVAKWAQTVDGRIATRSGHSQWISGPRSRRMVHRARGRTDVMLTGVGTVLADDPELTPRHGHVRRMPVRVVADSTARTPVTSRLLQTIAAGPVLIAARADRIADGDGARRAEALTAAGATVLSLPGDGQTPGGIDLDALLRRLAADGAARVMVEAGGMLVGRLMARALVQEAWVFTGPRLLGDERAPGGASGLSPSRIDHGIPMRLVDLRRRGDDVVTRWHVGSSAGG